jgi:hypothetical protein
MTEYSEYIEKKGGILWGTYFWVNQNLVKKKKKVNNIYLPQLICELMSSDSFMLHDDANNSSYTLSLTLNSCKSEDNLISTLFQPLAWIAASSVHSRYAWYVTGL